MSSLLPFLRLNISGSREFIVQNINSALIFFYCSPGSSSSDWCIEQWGQLRSLWLFSEILQCEWNTSRWLQQGITGCSAGLLHPADPWLLLPREIPSLGVRALCCTGSSVRKSHMGLALCFALGVAPKTVCEALGVRPERLKDPFQKSTTEQHSWQWVFDLKYLRYFSSFN